MTEPTVNDLLESSTSVYTTAMEAIQDTTRRTCQILELAVAAGEITPQAARAVLKQFREHGKAVDRVLNSHADTCGKHLDRIERSLP